MFQNPIKIINIFKIKIDINYKTNYTKEYLNIISMKNYKLSKIYTITKISNMPYIRNN